jgi:hypothetical protein
MRRLSNALTFKQLGSFGSTQLALPTKTRLKALKTRLEAFMDDSAFETELEGGFSLLQTARDAAIDAAIDDDTLVTARLENPVTRGRSRGPSARGGGSRAPRGARGGGRRGRGRIGRVVPCLTAATHGWNIRNRVPGNDVLKSEEDFAKESLTERARMCCRGVLQRLRVEKEARVLPQGRLGLVVLFLEPTLLQIMAWLNELIALKKLDRTPLKMPDMYSYVSVLLMSHLTSMSMERTVNLLFEIGLEPPALDLVRFISSHSCAFSPTQRGSFGGLSWHSQRDWTQQLTGFENLAF